MKPLRWNYKKGRTYTPQGFAIVVVEVCTSLPSYSRTFVILKREWRKSKLLSHSNSFFYRLLLSRYFGQNLMVSTELHSFTKVNTFLNSSRVLIYMLRNTKILQNTSNKSFFFFIKGLVWRIEPSTILVKGVDFKKGCQDIWVGFTYNSYGTSLLKLRRRSKSGKGKGGL